MDATLRMQQVFRDVFDDDEIEISDEMTAADIDDWDSLMHITLMVALETEFGIRFASAEVNGLKNVGALRRVIESKIG